MSRRTEIQVGVTVLVALVVLLWGVTWLKEFGLQKRLTVWHVRFPQTGGLGASDEVLVNGIRKGAVSKLQLAGDQVVVDLSLASDVRLTTDSRVAIRNVGLMGEKIIAVDLSLTGRPYTARDTISGIFEQGLPEVLANLGGTMTAIDRLAHDLEIVSGNLRANGDLEKTLANFRSTSEEIHAAVADNRELLHRTLTDASEAAGAAKELTADRKEQLVRTLDTIERSAQNIERLSYRMDSLRAQVQVLANRVDKGDGTLGQLVNDRKLYDDVRASVSSLNALIEDVKKNPKKYLHVSVF